MNKLIDIKNLPAELASVRKWMIRFKPEPKVAAEDEECVVYGRFSGPNQKEASIERQRDVTCSYAEHMKYKLRDEFLFADRGHTGDSLDGREALSALRKLAQSGAIKRILLYSWCRLSRRPADAMMLFDEFECLGVEIHVCAGNTTGRINYFQALILSIFAMEERERLLRTTNFAAFAAAAAGRNMAGIPYGFVKGRKRGDIAVDDEKMKVVVRIFDLFAVHGIHPRRIAYLLNRDGIPSPRGGFWTEQTIAGVKGKPGGILRNVKYVGHLVYGVTTVQRTPGRARKERTAGDLERLKSVELPDLARVDLNLFIEANDLLDSAEHTPRARQERASKSILLLHNAYRCVCGSPMRMVTRIGASGIRQLRCQAAWSHGVCDRRGSTSALQIEAEVLREIRDNILSPQAVDLFEATYVASAREARTKVVAERERLTRQLAEIDRWLDNSFLEALREGRSEAQMGRVCASLEIEKARIAAEVAGLVVPEQTNDIPKVQVDALRNAMNRLILRLPLRNPDEEDLKLVYSLRRLVSKVVLDRRDGRGGFTLNIQASLAGLAGPLDRISDDQTAADPVRKCSQVAVRTFVRGCAGTYGRPRVLPELGEFATNAALSCGYRTTDEDWSVIEPLWRHWDEPEKRNILDATLFYLRCGRVGLKSLPAPFDLGRDIEYRVNAMIRTGCWTSALEAMERIRSPTLEGIDTSRLQARVRRFEPTGAGRHA